MNRELLSQKLKELRIVNNYTQDYVAAALGIVRQTYSHYETGRRVPDAEVLYKLSGLYNISVDDLLHITMDVDRDESYDAPVPSASSTELSEYLDFYKSAYGENGIKDFYNEPSNRKKYMFATPIEKELLYHFKKMSEEDRNEMIEIAKIKARKNPEKEK